MVGMNVVKQLRDRADDFFLRSLLDRCEFELDIVTNDM